MQTHLEAVDLQCAGCTALATCVEDASQQILELGGLNAVLDAMQFHFEQADLQVRACGLLGDIAACSGGQLDVVDSGCLAAVLQSMEFHTTSDAVQDAGCRSLREFSMLAVDQDFGELGCVAAVLGAMSSFPLAIEVQLSACEALENFARSNEPSRLSIVDDRGIETVLSAMKSHANSPELQLSGCVLLQCLACTERGRSRFAEIDGAEVLIRTMRAQSSSTAVIELVFSLLWQLGVEGICWAFGENVLRAVIATMSVRIDSPGVQGRACGLLTLVTPSSVQHSNLVALGGVEAVTSAMKAHLTSAETQELGCRCLVSFCENTGCAEQLFRLGVIELVVAALSSLSASIRVVSASLLALVALVSADTNKTIQTDGLHSKVANAMMQYQSSESLQEIGCVLLWNLSVISKDPLKEFDFLCVRAVASAMQAHAGVAALQQACCDVIGLWAEDPELQNTLLELNIVQQLITAVQEHVDSDVLLISGCRALRAMAQDCDAGREAVCCLGGIDTMLRTMEAHLSSAELQQAGCEMLGVLASSSAIQTRIGELGGIESVIAVMRAYAGLLEVLLKAFGALVLCVRGNCANRDRLSASGGFAVILLFQREWLHNVAVQQAVCTALSECVASDTQREKFVREGGADVVISAMCAHTSNVEVQQVGCTALSHLAHRSAANKTRIADRDGVQTVLAAMEEHPESVHLQRVACSALANLFAVDQQRVLHTVVSAMKSHVLDADVFILRCKVLRLALASDCTTALMAAAVEAVLHGMQGCMARADAQQCACSTLWSLATCAQGLSAISAHGGVAQLVAAMRAHPTEPCLQAVACTVLTAIAKDEVLRAQIGDVGGAEVLLDAMRAHPSDSQVQAGGCAVLSILARHSDVVQVRVVELGGFKAIVSAMSSHLTDADVQTNCCSLLWHLARNSACQQSFASMGGVECVLSAMDRFPDEVKVQRAGCGAIWRLAHSSQANRKRITGLKGVEAVVRAMRLHPEAAELQQFGCGALRSLAGSRDSRVRIADTGGLEVVLNAMRRRPAVAKLQQAACGAVKSIAHANDSNRKRAVNSGSVEMLLKAMRDHPGVALLQKTACGALWALADDEAFGLKLGGLDGVSVLERAIRSHQEAAPDGSKVLVSLMPTFSI